MSDQLSKSFEIVKRFDDLPNDAVVSTKIAALVLGVADRTIRYHPDLTRVYISRGRYGYRVGNLRQVAHGGAPNSAKAQRLMQEVASAPDRATGEDAIRCFDFAEFPEAAREELERQLADTLAELPE
jgi:hypothetical protein